MKHRTKLTPHEQEQPGAPVSDPARSPNRTKLAPLEQEPQHATEHQTQGQAAREFATVEEALRYDAVHTPVPPAIAKRLQESTGKLPPPPPPRSWWHR